MKFKDQSFLLAGSIEVVLEYLVILNTIFQGCANLDRRRLVSFGLVLTLRVLSDQFEVAVLTDVSFG